ncbi:MAG: hypothetical protein ABJC26_09495 [Gemmatimonadaceae bacterium]
MAAFDDAFEQSTRNDTSIPVVVVPDGIDVAQVLERFEREYAELVSHAQIARQSLVMATQLAGDWGTRAQAATKQQRAMLAAQALIRQHEHETDVRYFQTEVAEWEWTVHYCEAAMALLRTRLSVALSM